MLITIHRLSQGGADRVMVLLANGLASAGIPTAIVVLRSGGENEKGLLAKLDARIALRYAGSAMGSRHLELIRGAIHIRRQVECARPDVVLASSSNMGLVTGLSARSRSDDKPRYVMKLTNPVIRPRDDNAVKRLYRRRLYRLIFGRFDKILLLSPLEQVALSRIYPHLRDRFETVANPYVTPAMIAAPLSGAAPAPPLLLTSARMMPQKRLDRLLAAFAQIVDKRARLVILGDGPERPRLLRQAALLGIADRVDLPGYVEDVVPWLQRASLFVLSSDYEGLPAAVIEALACNIPVVTTDCFDMARTLLDKADGCTVVPREDVAGFARAVDQSLRMPGPPKGLPDIALPYRVEAAISAHVDTLKALIAHRP